ncbi:F-box/kelch-repeat protein At1g57790-like [Coffea arabica]|uniref:F-box/kelch-repeat protein At1g57790-like n=1 Tax=Coffea arabica TaxID=13443 RepID=A0A6P6SNF0_COFAR|nr:F-box/kelch-repeat protein At1g57790-like [Coffea arabica]
MAEKIKKRKGKTRPWADLHEDLLRTIIQKLCLYDRVHSILVCKEWQAKILTIQPLTSSRLPWWMFQYNWRKSFQNNSQKLTLDGMLFNPDSRKLYPVKKDNWKSKYMSLVFQARPCASEQGWLLFFKGLRKNGTSFFFYNPFSNDFMLLPSLSSCTGYVRAAFSRIPTSPDCVVFIAYHVNQELHIGTYTFGETNWRTQVVAQAGDIVKSIVYSSEKSEVYCVFWGGKLAKFDVVGRCWSLVKERSLYHLASNKQILIEYKGQLLLFSIHDIQLGYIYRFDWSLMDWIALDSLGGGAIFIDFSHSLSIAVEEASGWEDNIVYTNYGNSRYYYSSYSLKTRQSCDLSEYYGYEPKQGTYCGTTWIQPQMQGKLKN